MDHADDGDDIDVFVYMGGDQVVPEDVTHVRIHKSVKIIRRRAFEYCRSLVSIEMHDGVAIVEEEAFRLCSSLRRIKLPGVRVIEKNAFAGCWALESVEFGDKLETIGKYAFECCISLRSIKLKKVRAIEKGAFVECKQLVEVKLSEDLETIRGAPFFSCRRLRHIVMPLKANLLENNVVFAGCNELSQVSLSGGIHKTISSLLLDSWKSEMIALIDRINRDLPYTLTEVKNAVIRQWMEIVIERIEHFKSEHYSLLKENMTQLELALWDANLQQQEERLWLKWVDNKQPAKKAKIDIEAVRHEARITSGASVVIKNVLPFLKLE